MISLISIGQSTLHHNADGKTVGAAPALCHKRRIGISELSMTRGKSNTHRQGVSDPLSNRLLFLGFFAFVQPSSS